MTHQLFCGDCLDVLPELPHCKCLFADPPDNIGLKYSRYKDELPADQYVGMLDHWLRAFLRSADIVWLSFNARWTAEVGAIVWEILREHPRLEFKPCQQVISFGQHRHTDLGNNHRPLYRLRWPEGRLYPDAIRVRSWRQENGDKRADPRGRVPGDVFSFPRVTGNSKQRRRWHATQLHEGLVERCIRLSTAEGERVCDPFAGTGTTLRVCKRIPRPCTLIEIDSDYCRRIAEEHGLDVPLGEAAQNVVPVARSRAAADPGQRPLLER